jgi:hypothetical protein
MGNLGNAASNGAAKPALPSKPQSIE